LISRVLSLFLMVNFESTKQSNDPKSMSSLNALGTSDKCSLTTRDFVLGSSTAPNHGPKFWVFLKQSVPQGMYHKWPLTDL